jgi:hypothetical protein
MGILPRGCPFTDLNENWRITVQYFDDNNGQISSGVGGAWHIYGV